MSVAWKCVAFTELTHGELYDIMRLRQRVFVVEQNCPYVDADNKDQASFHLMGSVGDALGAYARILPPGLAYDDWSIGRVITSPETRGSGIGRELMKKAIAEVNAVNRRPVPITIGAQARLERFYASLGFVTQGDIYLEDNIEHLEMRREAAAI